MSLSPEQLHKIAHLARLTVSTADEPTYLADLSRTLAMVDAIAAAPTDGVEPLATPLEQSLPLRDDRVTEIVERERLQQGAPAVENGLYLVPRVIE
ncbi:MAG: Asp-tRNA(Asn)/Glu-tRNA(Gln) amidotransferase subunit GatC [Pseudomonadota bacterium]|nr:Asp-tRNA(Asn)/Glu-tRNA(Gln) amidotransferase subunit GatC [Pseudomonadota bacterium]